MKNQSLPVSISKVPSLLNQGRTTHKGRKLSSLVYILALISMLATSTVYGLGTPSQSKSNKANVTNQTSLDTIQNETNHLVIIADMKLN